ncbi:MAG: nuclear transport factor 2 family protein, partial [candidate division KSB1 bacterium]|nr:nuclear transport factor 2 family protein [candidate division KSB1 bacterium]
NASIENAKVTIKDQVIKVNQYGNTTWFSEIAEWDLVAQGQAVNLQGLRFTVVLEKRNGNWVVVQFHSSIPVSGQAAAY